MSYCNVLKMNIIKSSAKMPLGTPGWRTSDWSCTRIVVPNLYNVIIYFLLLLRKYFEERLDPID